MTSQLDGYAAAFRDARARAHVLTDGCTREAFNWKLAPDRWSVAECLVHLNTVHGRDLPAFQAVVDRALGDPRAPRAAGPFRYGWASRLFVRSVSPGSRPLPTMPAMRPPAPPSPAQSAHDPATVLAEFDAITDGFLALVETMDGLDVGRIRVASPFAPLFKLPLGAYVEALSQHALRHVGQAERVAAERARTGPA